MVAPVKGATRNLCRIALQCIVSIHAPVKGATPAILIGMPTMDVSIHAPVKGATCVASNQTPRLNCFNPRTRKGCDSSISHHFRVQTRVSIHAPVKGATAPLSGPVNRAFQGHFSRTSSFSDENEGDFPKGFYFTCVFNGLAMRASHGGRPVRLGCPHVTVW